MAANNYYEQPGYGHDHYNDYYDRRNDAPLPPLPPPSSQSQSPFDDPRYSYQHQTPSQSYSGASGRIPDDADPYEDNDAIPLTGRRKKHDSTASVAPILAPEPVDPFVRDTDPHKKRRRKSKDGWFSGKITWVCFTLSVVQLVVFIAEIVRMGVLTGTPIAIKPQFNPMIGPSPYVLINMGARYQPCMHNMANVQNNTQPILWPCPDATSFEGDDVSCTLSDLCGFGGVPNPEPNGDLSDPNMPNQWWRFIVPIFLHAGIIHIGFNLLLQLTLGRDVEKLIGSVRFVLVYFAAGIFGFVLGGNFAATGIASSGCSGSIFGILAITLLDLLYNWSTHASPKVELAWIFVDIVIAFILGLLPGLDNFSHIGGFLMGLVLGVCLLRSPAKLSQRTSKIPVNYDPYQIPETQPAPSRTSREEGITGFFRQPIGFFRNRKGLWWSWWLVRAAALLGCLIGFILLLRNFYEWRTGCGWCKYLSCLPVNGWCQTGNLDFSSTNVDMSPTDGGQGNS
ncbi:hypothetical protein MBLNU230_g0055t1 [Neophaeotheca triangularis]